MKFIPVIIISIIIAIFIWKLPRKYMPIKNMMLKKYDKIKIRVITWNVEGQVLPKDLNELLGYDPKSRNSIPIFVLIGLQGPGLLGSIRLWSSLETAVKDKGFKEIGYDVSENIGFHLLVKNYYSDLTEPDSLRFKNYFWPIGSASVANIRLNEMNITMINSHLSLNGSCPSKLQDFYKNASKHLERENSDLIFWFGEMNCMVNETPEKALQLMKERKLYELLSKDSLTIALRDNKTFPGWQEQKIIFRPTYKLLPNSKKYDLSVTPSWTDRILYKTNKTVKPLKYRRYDNYNKTQHRPVIAEFLVFSF